VRLLRTSNKVGSLFRFRSGTGDGVEECARFAIFAARSCEVEWSYGRSSWFILENLETRGLQLSGVSQVRSSGSDRVQPQRDCDQY